MINDGGCRNICGIVFHDFLSESLSMWHVSAEFIPSTNRQGQWEPVTDLLQQAEAGKNFMKLIMGEWDVCL